MTKSDLLLSMADAWDPIPLTEAYAPGMARGSDNLELLDASEYGAYMTPTGAMQIGWVLTEAGRAAWAAARAAG